TDLRQNAWWTNTCACTAISYAGAAQWRNQRRAILDGSDPGGSMPAVKITVRKNGPYRVEAAEGSIELVDAEGNPYDLTGKTAFALGGCGGSVNKPFCDGTHSRIGFEGAESAVRKADGENPKPA